MCTSSNLEVSSVAHAKSNSLGVAVSSPCDQRLNRRLNISLHHLCIPLFSFSVDVEPGKYLLFTFCRYTLSSKQLLRTSVQNWPVRAFPLSRYWAPPLLFFICYTYFSGGVTNFSTFI